VRLDGLHHVTAITADVATNLNFYGRLLGLRLVWQGVNADDPQMPRRYALRNECRLARADRPRERRWGASDPTAAVVPSAIANAAYDALGMRLARGIASARQGASGSS